MYPEIAARRHVLVALRVLLVNLVPVGCLLAHLPAVALASILAGLAADRFAFYGLAAAQSTEAEMARVDALIG